MTAATVAPAAPATGTAPTEIDLEHRMAIASAGLDALLDRAATAVDERLEAQRAPLDLNDLIQRPMQAPAPPCPYTTPLAQLLHRAHARMLQDGWCRDALRDEAGALCLLGALRAAGATGRTYDLADDILYETIRRIDPRAHSTSAWNDAQMSARGPLLVLERAARTAADRGL